MAKRVILRIEIRESARSELQAYLERTDITQVAAISRLLEWFAEQDDSVKACILDLYPGSLRPDVVKVILQRMAQNGDVGG